MSGSKRFLELLDVMRGTHLRKNSDYANSAVDPWKNFRLVEQMGIPAHVGAMVRMTDKVMRIMNLIEKESRNEERAVLDESLIDTSIDLAVYSVILICLYEEYRDKKLTEFNGIAFDNVGATDESTNGSDANGYGTDDADGVKTDNVFPVTQDGRNIFSVAASRMTNLIGGNIPQTPLLILHYDRAKYSDIRLGKIARGELSADDEFRWVLSELFAADLITRIEYAEYARVGATYIGDGNWRINTTIENVAESFTREAQKEVKASSDLCTESIADFVTRMETNITTGDMTESETFYHALTYAKARRAITSGDVHRLRGYSAVYLGNGTWKVPAKNVSLSILPKAGTITLRSVNTENGLDDVPRNQTVFYGAFTQPQFTGKFYEIHPANKTVVWTNIKDEGRFPRPNRFTVFFDEPTISLFDTLNRNMQWEVATELFDDIQTAIKFMSDAGYIADLNDLRIYVEADDDR